MAAGERGSGKYVTIKIPSELYRTLGGMIHDTGFRSVTEFVIHGLTGYSPDDIRNIRERLRALGYLD